jgi:hypothetical protein
MGAQRTGERPAPYKHDVRDKRVIQFFRAMR